MVFPSLFPRQRGSSIDLLVRKRINKDTQRLYYKLLGLALGLGFLLHAGLTFFLVPARPERHSHLLRGQGHPLLQFLTQKERDIKRGATVSGSIGFI
jgi:hypothetical protein